MNLADQDGEVWIDGTYIPLREAKVHALTHTLHYGVGAFEGMRAYEAKLGTAIFRLSEHTDRLYNSAHILGMKMPFAKNILIEVQCEILRRNHFKSAYVRPLVYYGSEHLGLQTKPLTTHVLVAAWEWGSYFSAEDEERGITVHTSSFTRNHPHSMMGKAKSCGNYINSIMALQEAQSFGCDEALMLDHQGFVAEGSSANVFIVRNHRIFTPTTGSILEGITRDSIITLARDLGYEVIEKNITRDDVYTADEMFFTGSAAEMTAVNTVDKRTIGAGHRGPITKEIHQEFTRVVRGLNNKYDDWLRYI